MADSNGIVSLEPGQGDAYIQPKSTFDPVQFSRYALEQTIGNRKKAYLSELKKQQDLAKWKEGGIGQTKFDADRLNFGAGIVDDYMARTKKAVSDNHGVLSPQQMTDFNTEANRYNGIFDVSDKQMETADKARLESQKKDVTGQRDLYTSDSQKSILAWRDPLNTSNLPDVTPELKDRVAKGLAESGYKEGGDKVKNYEAVQRFRSNHQDMLNPVRHADYSTDAGRIISDLHITPGLFKKNGISDENFTPAQGQMIGAQLMASPNADQYSEQIRGDLKKLIPDEKQHDELIAHWLKESGMYEVPKFTQTGGAPTTATLNPFISPTLNLPHTEFSKELVLTPKAQQFVDEKTKEGVANGLSPLEAAHQAKLAFEKTKNDVIAQKGFEKIFATQYANKHIEDKPDKIPKDKTNEPFNPETDITWTQGKHTVDKDQIATFLKDKTRLDHPSSTPEQQKVEDANLDAVMNNPKYQKTVETLTNKLAKSYVAINFNKPGTENKTININGTDVVPKGIMRGLDGKPYFVGSARLTDPKSIFTMMALLHDDKLDKDQKETLMKKYGFEIVDLDVPENKTDVAGKLGYGESNGGVAAFDKNVIKGRLGYSHLKVK